MVGDNNIKRHKKAMRRSFFKNSRVVAGSRPHQKVALMGSWALWTGGRMTMCNCGRAVGWRGLFFNFPNQAQPVITIPLPPERSEPNFKVDNACRGKGTIKPNVEKTCCKKLPSQVLVFSSRRSWNFAVRWGNFAESTFSVKATSYQPAKLVRATYLMSFM